jgi:hypothetical protein
VISLL